MKIIVRTIIALLFLTPVIAGAQSTALSESFSVSSSPTNPAPNQTTTFKLSSRSVGLELSNIRWFKNGKLEMEGYGLNKYTTRVGAVGIETTISAEILTPEGNLVRISKKIRPAGVRLIWEADSYTPPFYKGKGLPAHQSEVRVVAIPNILNSSKTHVRSKDINYTWLLNGKKVSEQSGLGEDILIFNGKLISRPQTITVLANYPLEEITASETINLSFVEPELIVYKENPLTGFRSNFAVRNSFVKETEEAFVVEPYYFSRRAVEGGLLNFEWTVDNKDVPTLIKKRRVVFGGESAGKSVVSIKAVNPLVLLQEAFISFSVSIR